MLYESANAKINLFLDVTARRPDGYHELHSCMQTVGLSDTIAAEILPPKDGRSIRLQCSDTSLSCDEKNLAYRAAALFMEATDTAYDLRLHIEKRIPVSAGLGGGSADAAAVLRLLNKNLPKPLSTEELCSIGVKLGADVPFCITGGTCRCEGVGEILTPVKTYPDYTVLIAKDGEGVSTPEAFSRLDEAHNEFIGYTPRDTESIYAALSGGDVRALAGAVHNIFEEVILPIRPAVGEIKGTMTQHGARATMMSGSGPSVWGIFDNADAAKRAEAALLADGHRAYVCEMLKEESDG
jgi:4-diphosphocytidyl-2-C-methyl-D-erythritol kinase